MQFGGISVAKKYPTSKGPLFLPSVQSGQLIYKITEGASVDVVSNIFNGSI